MPEALNAVIYARYSSDRQTEQSIEGQLRECYAFAKANDIAVIDTYIDRAISGKTDNRPAFQKMIEDSAKRQFQAVIVYRLDRFTRNRYDSAIYMEQNKKAPARAKAEINYLLSTKLFCGKCRSAMVGESGTSKTGKKYYYYACVKKKREKACDKSNVKKDWIEDLVIQRTVTDILKDDGIDKIADRLVELQKAEAAESGTMLYLENSLAEIQASIKNIMTAIEKGIITESTKTRLTELEDEKRNVEIELAKESIARRIISREQIIYWISSFKDGDILFVPLFTPFSSMMIRLS